MSASHNMPVPQPVTNTIDLFYPFARQREPVPRGCPTCPGESTLRLRRLRADREYVDGNCRRCSTRHHHSKGVQSILIAGAFTNESRLSPSAAVPVSTSISCSNSCSCEGGFCSVIEVSSASSLSWSTLSLTPYILLPTAAVQFQLQVQSTPLSNFWSDMPSGTQDLGAARPHTPEPCRIGCSTCWDGFD